MRKMKEIIKSRLFQYMVYAIIYLAVWEIASFELAVIIGISTILGEISYLDLNKKK